MSAPLLAAWINDLNPIALRLTDWLQVRWYGLAYVAGFGCAWLVMRHFARRGLSVLKEADLADFVTLTALFGVMLGGRLGYMLLYTPHEFFHNPLVFFKLTSGGMASHGGIAGIVIFTWFHARKKKVSWPGLGDMLVVGAPLGILFGRIANFINGELWGHEAPGLKWGVKFPAEVASTDHPAYVIVRGYLEEKAGSDAVKDDFTGTLLRQLREGDQALRTLLDAELPTRHPSQLYEALLEGLLLFALLFFIRSRWKNLPHGVLTGVFFIGYAIARIVGETWRVPDARGLSWLEPLSPGQQYSLPMLLIGAAFLWYAWKNKDLGIRN